jgi:hypothetical protein
MSVEAWVVVDISISFGRVDAGETQLIVVLADLLRVGEAHWSGAESAQLRDWTAQPAAQNEQWCLEPKLVPS